MSAFEVVAVTGIGEVDPGTDLAAVLLSRTTLEDGDILVVTSKVVSKAEGRVTTASKASALAAETDRVVARRGETAIVRTRHGLVMAAAGIDASNTGPGSLVLLPEDPDASARRLRARLQELTGCVVGVVVSDTSGRAWRTGQTDIAIGAAGIRVLDDHAGRTDAYGNVLAVTAPAVADEIAAAGDLAKGKLGMTPVAVVRGLADLVLAAGTDGPGAGALVRDEGTDMFGLGAREAVMQALAVPGPTDRPSRGFGDPALVSEVLVALGSVGGTLASIDVDGSEVVVRLLVGDPRGQGRLETRLEVAARAHGWQSVEADRRTDGDRVRFRPALP